MILKLSTAMELAFAEAQAAQARGEVPVGAVIETAGGEILASAGNQTIALRDPTAHAEMLAIRAAARKLDSERLGNCILHVTLEPCTMCAAAISHARIARVVYALDDPKMGGASYFAQPTCHHRPEVVAGIGETRARSMLQDFFKTLRRDQPGT